MVGCSLDHTRQATIHTLGGGPVSGKASMGRSCQTPFLPYVRATQLRSQLKSAHTRDAGQKQRAKELLRSVVFYTHQGNDPQFISASWLLCKLPNVRNITTVSRESGLPSSSL